jgi:hypothetical protein
MSIFSLARSILPNSIAAGAAIILAFGFASNASAVSITVGTAYQEAISSTCAGTGSSCTLYFATVPSPKLLTITHVTCAANVTAATAGGGSIFRWHLSTVNPSLAFQLFANYLDPALVGSGGNQKFYQVNHPALHLVTNPNRPAIHLTILSGDPTSMLCNITGTLR